MDDCIFCKIANNKESRKHVFENEMLVVFPSINPVAETHLLIVPKKHTTNFMELDDNTISEMKNTAQALIKGQNLDGGYKLIFNGGKYQAVPHVHWHLLGGKLEDEHDPLNRT